MIYIIIEWDTYNVCLEYSMYTNKKEYNQHLKICEQMYQSSSKSYFGGYRYRTKIVKWSPVKAIFVENFNDYDNPLLKAQTELEETINNSGE